MTKDISRRDALKGLGALGASVALGGDVRLGRVLASEIVVAGQRVQITVASVASSIVRITMTSMSDGSPTAALESGALIDSAAGSLVRRSADASDLARVIAGELVVSLDSNAPILRVDRANGGAVQRFIFDAAVPGFTFMRGAGPLLGLGEGGPQFDRAGSTDRMVAGQGGYRLSTHGTRAPIPWMISTGDNWALFVHQPDGSFDFTTADARFAPRSGAPLPIDLFVVASSDPLEIMHAYARITGTAELPPKWAFGYLQSHRTLAGPEEIAGVARTFRERKLPCDALIYLGTEFAPSGWNTRNGEFAWHPGNFPHPREQLAALHDEHFKVVLHAVVEGHHLTGTVHDACTAPPLPSGRTPDGKWPPDRQVACYWPVHKSVMDDGADGWWPDQGDGFDGPSERNRQQMYWEGPQLYRPDERPFALHRNASPGTQRYGGLIWSGDVQSRWETLATHVAVGINTALSGLPYWGTDIGGFVPTAEYTGELYARWFQFGAFCPLFRSHGRNWHLHTPWGWDGGDGGPPETTSFHADPAELHNTTVEPICRKYLELRYRLMPYLYTAVRDCHETGIPIVRALWLHHADDPAAVARGDEYLWGRDMLVAPVVEKGAASRTLYLPRGRWLDFWTEESLDGGREVTRTVDLSTMPLYVRAGAVISFDPVRQYADEPVTAPTTLVVYPGASATSSWYDDDGHTFAHRRGEWTRLTMTWDDEARRLTLSLAPGSRPVKRRELSVRVAGSPTTHTVTFTGQPVSIAL